MSDFHVSFVATLLHSASAHTPPGGTQPAHVHFTALPLATRTSAMIVAALDGPAASCTESWTDSQGKACNTIEASSDTPMRHSTRPLAHDETAQCLPFNWPLAVPPLVEPFPELLHEHAAADSKNAPRPTCLDALLDSTDTKHTCLATAVVAKDLEPNRTAFGSGTSDMAVAVLKDECSLKVPRQSLQRTTTTALTDLLYVGTPLKGADLPAGGVPQVLAQGVPDPSVAKESQSCLDRLTHGHMPTKLGLVRRDTTAVDPERLVSQMLDLAVTDRPTSPGWTWRPRRWRRAAAEPPASTSRSATPSRCRWTSVPLPTASRTRASGSATGRSPGLPSVPMPPAAPQSS